MGKRSGKGKLTQPDGSYYDGEWLDDKKHGRGTEREGAYIRTGPFVKGVRDGVFSEYHISYPSGVYTMRYTNGVRGKKGQD